MKIRTILPLTLTIPLSQIFAAITVEEFSVVASGGVATVDDSGTSGSFLSVRPADDSSIGGELSANKSAGTGDYTSDGEVAVINALGGFVFLHWDGPDGDARGNSRMTSMNLLPGDENLGGSVIRIYGDAVSEFVFFKMVFWGPSQFEIAETLGDDPTYQPYFRFTRDIDGGEEYTPSQLLLEYKFSDLVVPMTNGDQKFTDFAAFADIRRIEVQLASGIIGLDRIEIANPDDGVSGSVWIGRPVDENGNVDTGDWLGEVNVSDDPYIWSYDLESWLYIDPDEATPAGSWIYVIR